MGADEALWDCLWVDGCVGFGCGGVAEVEVLGCFVFPCSRSGGVGLGRGRRQRGDISGYLSISGVTLAGCVMGSGRNGDDDDEDHDDESK